MKKLFKKSLPLLMAGLMFVSSVLPVAATVSENQTITTPSTGITQVYYNQESTFGITIPKLIDLGSDKETNYTVILTGDISSDETILVVPDESFLMKDQNIASPKDDVTATVTQDKTEWKFNEFETIGNGKVSAPGLSAGNWKGKFYFNAKLQNCNISVTAKDENGNDLNASASYITGTEKENLLNSLVDSGYVNSTDEVDALINVDSDSFDGIADTTFDVSDTYSEGDTIAILHYNEETKEWEYIGTETVDENGLINGDFTSYSPVAFVKVNADGSYSKVLSQAGLYDANDNLLCSWENLGIDVEQDYSLTTYSYANTPHSIITKKYPTATKMVLPQVITKIGSNAIRDCDNLTDVIFPNTITTLGAASFYDCDNLNNIILPNTITTLGAGAFEYCDNLQSINLPSSIESMGNAICYGCRKLSDVTIEPGCKVIGYSAFYATDYYYNIRSITIPGSVESIGQSAFRYQPLTTVIIEDGVQTIGPAAFGACEKLTELFIPASITSIGNEAFDNCYLLKTVYYGGTKEQWNTITKGSYWNRSWPSDVEIIYNYTE